MPLCWGWGWGPLGIQGNDWEVGGGLPGGGAGGIINAPNAKLTRAQVERNTSGSEPKGLLGDLIEDIRRRREGEEAGGSNGERAEGRKRKGGDRKDKSKKSRS